MKTEQDYLDEAYEYLGLPPVRRRGQAAAKSLASGQPDEGEGVSLTDVGECLRAAREEYGMSLGELEEETGMSRGRLSRIENRVSPNPTILTLTRIAGAIGLQIVVTLRPLKFEE